MLLDAKFVPHIMLGLQVYKNITDVRVLGRNVCIQILVSMELNQLSYNILAMWVFPDLTLRELYGCKCQTFPPQTPQITAKNTHG